MESDYSFDDGPDSQEDEERVSPAPYYRRNSGVGDTVAEQRVYSGEPRRSAPRRPAPAQPAEGMIGHLARGVARIFALLFLAAGIGMWMVYFGAMYILGLFGGTGMTPEDISNDLLFGLLSSVIALVLLMWSRSDKPS